MEDLKATARALAWVLGLGINKVALVGLRAEVLSSDVVVKAMPELTAMDVTGVTVTGEELAKLLKAYPHLGLGDGGIKFDDELKTDAFVEVVAKTRPWLTVIDLSRGHDVITDSAVIQLAEKCPALTSIDLRACDKVTSKGVGALRSANPDIKIMGR